MLEVIINIRKNNGKREHIGKLLIENDLTGNEEIANYIVTAKAKAHNSCYNTYREIKNFPRAAGAWALVTKAFKALEE